MFTADGLQDMIDPVLKTKRRIGFTISSSKTKVMTVNHSAPYQIIVDNEPNEHVDESKYLKSTVEQVKTFLPGYQELGESLPV